MTPYVRRVPDHGVEPAGAHDLCKLNVPVEGVDAIRLFLIEQPQAHLPAVVEIGSDEGVAALDVVGLTEPGFETAGARLGELYPADGRSGWDLEPQGSPEWKRQIRRDAKPVNPMDHQGRAPGRYGSSYGLGGVTVTRSGHAYAN